MTATHEMPERSAGSTKVPSNRLALDGGLVDEIKAMYRNGQRSTREIASKAYQLQVQYRPADSNRYDPKFDKWWRDYEMNGVFGSRSNFSKYAAIGEALERATIGRYADRLPVSFLALYEVSQLTSDEIALCVENRYSRAAVGAEFNSSEKAHSCNPPECQRQGDTLLEKAVA